MTLRQLWRSQAHLTWGTSRSSLRMILQMKVMEITLTLYSLPKRTLGLLSPIKQTMPKRKTILQIKICRNKVNPCQRKIEIKIQLKTRPPGIRILSCSSSERSKKDILRRSSSKRGQKRVSKVKEMRSIEAIPWFRETISNLLTMIWQI